MFVKRHASSVILGRVGHLLLACLTNTADIAVDELNKPTKLGSEIVILLLLNMALILTINQVVQAFICRHTSNSAKDDEVAILDHVQGRDPRAAEPFNFLDFRGSSSRALISIL
jgi:hypothetical protein